MDRTWDNSIQEEEKMDVKNNVPSFKLHDPVTISNTNLTTLDDNPTNFNQDSSSSFVVLGKDSMDIQDAEAQASLLASYVDIHRKSMSVVCTIAILLYCILYFSTLPNNKVSFLTTGLQINSFINDRGRDAKTTNRNIAGKCKTEGNIETEQCLHDTKFQQVDGMARRSNESS